MIKVDKKVRLLSAALILSLLLFPVLGYGSNGLGSAEQQQVKDILTERYANLPSIEFEFDDPAANYEGITFRPYSNLAISVPNIADGLVLGVLTYGDTNYLMMAVELPGDIDADFGAGLIDFSTNEAVFAAAVELSDQTEKVEEIGFELSSAGSDSPNLDFVANGRRYVLGTKVPKSL
jgi:hypothetical protein